MHAGGWQDDRPRMPRVGFPSTTTSHRAAVWRTGSLRRLLSVVPRLPHRLEVGSIPQIQTRRASTTSTTRQRVSKSVDNTRSGPHLLAQRAGIEVVLVFRRAGIESEVVLKMPLRLRSSRGTAEKKHRYPLLYRYSPNTWYPSWGHPGIFGTTGGRGLGPRLVLQQGGGNTPCDRPPDGTVGAPISPTAQSVPLVARFGGSDCQPKKRRVAAYYNTPSCSKKRDRHRGSRHCDQESSGQP
ncbi:MAG: hypothetical protein KatS3mg111_3918 [Pirellulaceae bacterium]|nr:MAG: hypothetical protein KatS3mg111_3918 [Pirellulaceae bacterium]